MKRRSTRLGLRSRVLYVVYGLISIVLGSFLFRYVTEPVLVEDDPLWIFAFIGGIVLLVAGFCLIILKGLLGIRDIDEWSMRPIK
nr:hypothetical protein [uncultured archaeon]